MNLNYLTIMHKSKSKIIFSFLFISSCLILLSSCKDNPTSTSQEPSGYLFRDHHPAWSPDGNTIAYIHEVFQNEDTTNNKPGIYLINPDGNNKRLLLYGWQQAPEWSSDNQWIVFHLSGVIYKIKINGDSLTQLTENYYNSFFPTWSNNGEWIAFDSNMDSPNGMNFIWKMKKDGSNKIRIAYDTVNGEIREPAWVSDKIVHMRYFIGDHQNQQICIMDTNGQNLTRVTYDIKMKDLPKLSVDKSKIIFTVIGNNEMFQVWIINNDGSNMKKLTNLNYPLGMIYEQGYTPSWSPDGNKIVYCNSMPDNGKLWVMEADGSCKKQITF